MKKRKSVVAVLGALAITVSLGVHYQVNASDHDDGTQATQNGALNLTDLYLFREDNQTGNGAHSGNLVLIMDSYGHTQPGQQVHFSTNAQYDFNISRVTDKNATPTGTSNVILRFEFGEPNGDQRQPITMRIIRDGNEVTASTSDGSGEFLTTSYEEGKAGNNRTNRLTVDSQEVHVFAGMREDPFFFDFEQFVKVRAGAAGLGPKEMFRPPGQAVDFFRNENINSIVVRVPIALLQSAANEPVFDVWETVKLR